MCSSCLSSDMGGSASQGVSEDGEGLKKTRGQWGRPVCSSEAAVREGLCWRPLCGDWVTGMWSL